MVLENQSMVLTHGFSRVMDCYSHTCMRGWVGYDIMALIYYWVNQPMVLTHGIIKAHDIFLDPWFWPLASLSLSWY